MQRTIEQDKEQWKNIVEIQKKIVEIKTSLLKDKIYERIIKVKLLETGHEQHELLLLLTSDLIRLEIFQEILDNDCGEVFQGTLALVG